MTVERTIYREVLPNGLVIVTEPMSHVRSASIGIWLRTGSRSEAPARNGIAHFLEHMVFKGTERRTAEQIAREVDSIGGMMDAFTAKEMVSFNAKVLDEHLPIAWDVLADLALRPLFDKDEVGREKQVVLEEIKMDQDNPESVAHEMLFQNFWSGHPLGQPIIGTPETVLEFSRDALVEAHARWYAPKNIVVTAAGHVEENKIVDLVAKEFAALAPGDGAPPSAAPEPHGTLASQSKRELEQVHICVGVPSVHIADGRRYAVAVLNTILGGGMSSRLFQNIRERQGLAYAVFSEVNPYSDAGLLTVYAGTSLESTEKVLGLIAAELRALKNELVTVEELRRAKDHLKGSMILSLESTGARMANLARAEMYFGHFFSQDEILAAIEAVTREEVLAAANQFFLSNQVAATIVGNLDGFQLRREQLAC
ncbi:MAG TPA: pitrilysin family protein [Candidatus Acidoferrum sp.]|nr:pitrilysin family protein [Candidatus Acidoferrum sp.]